jgi:hypothetical protein
MLLSSARIATILLTAVVLTKTACAADLCDDLRSAFTESSNFHDLRMFEIHHGYWDAGGTFFMNVSEGCRILQETQAALGYECLMGRSTNEADANTQFEHLKSQIQNCVLQLSYSEENTSTDQGARTRWWFKNPSKKIVGFVDFDRVDFPFRDIPLADVDIEVFTRPDQGSMYSLVLAVQGR